MLCRGQPGLWLVKNSSTVLDGSEGQVSGNLWGLLSEFFLLKPIYFKIYFIRNSHLCHFRQRTSTFLL